MRAAVARCRGLRLLRQDPWECLASFICSSTKQIVQIRQIVALLSERWGRVVPTPPEAALRHAFPTPESLARAGEQALRDCKLGFRAPYLLDAARRVVEGRLDLAAVARMDTAEARCALMEIHGVGRKIADCVLLFAYGRQDAFPIDVWVRRALIQKYFPKARRIAAARLEAFSQTYFGPYSGYAQQYLFHHVRLEAGR
jgi:N-glycosylase/DNA lyase